MEIFSDVIDGIDEDDDDHDRMSSLAEDNHLF